MLLVCVKVKNYEKYDCDCKMTEFSASTVCVQWDLVCSRKGMNKATATVFFVGVMVAAPVFGFLSDR